MLVLLLLLLMLLLLLLLLLQLVLLLNQRRCLQVSVLVQRRLQLRQLQPRALAPPEGVAAQSLLPSAARA